MKKSLCLFTILAFATLSFAQVSTYILVRHAEKDTTAQGSKMMASDPPLSKDGEQRAIDLVGALKDYSIDGIFSTDYARTKSTATPISKKSGKAIQTYSPKDLKTFVDQLLLQKGKTILIVGHSNTTPALANLLLKEEKFKALDEAVYNKIFIITVNGDKAESKVLEY